MEKVKFFNVVREKVENIKLDKENPNEMDKLKMQGLSETIKKFGFLEPIVVDQNNVMVDGEHRFKALRDMGEKEIPVIRVNVNALDKKIIRQTMNKIRGSHNPRKDIEELISIEKGLGAKELSKYLGIEKKYLEDFINSKEQVPENYLNLIIKEKKDVNKIRTISLKLTVAQTKNILSKLGDLKINDIALIPVGGLLIKAQQKQ